MTLDEYLKEVEKRERGLRVIVAEEDGPLGFKVERDLIRRFHGMTQEIPRLLEIIRVQNEALSYLDDVFDDVRKAQAKVQEIVKRDDAELLALLNGGGE